jgi:hypothetical protein
VTNQILWLFWGCPRREGVRALANTEAFHYMAGWASRWGQSASSYVAHLERQMSPFFAYDASYLIDNKPAPPKR